MNAQDSAAPPSFQLTFHAVSGERKSFNIQPALNPNITVQDIRQEIRRSLKEDWWSLKTPERTIFINPGNVLTVDLTPPVEVLEGEGFPHTELATEIIGRAAI